MTDIRSAAEPDMLTRYADVATQLDTHLRTEAGKLADVLQRFVSRCTEYSVGVEPRLAQPLVRHSQLLEARDQWVGQVGHAFRQADRGTLAVSAWRATQWAIPGNAKDNRGQQVGSSPSAQAVPLAITSAVSGAVQWIKQAGVQVKNFWQPIKTAFGRIASVFNRPSGLISNLAAGARSFVAKALPAIVNVAKKAFKWFGGLIKGLFGKSGLLKRLIQGLRQAFAKIAQVAGKAFNFVMTIAQFIPIPVVQAVVRAVQLVQLAVKVVKGIKDGFKQGLGGLIAGVLQVIPFGKVAGDVAGTFSKLGGLGAKVGKVLGAVSTGISKGVAFVQGLWSKVSGAFSGVVKVVNTAKTWIKGVVDALPAKVTTVVNRAVSWVQGKVTGLSEKIVGRVREVADKALGDLKGLGIKLLDKVTGGIQRFGEKLGGTVGGWIKSAGNWLLGKGKQLLDKGVQFLKQKLEHVLSKVTDAATFVKGVVAKLGSKVIQVATKAANWVGGKITQLSDWVKDKIGRGVQWVGMQFTALSLWRMLQVAKIVAKLKNLTTKLWSHSLLGKVAAVAFGTGALIMVGPQLLSGLIISGAVVVGNGLLFANGVGIADFKPGMSQQDKLTLIQQRFIELLASDLPYWQKRLIAQDLEYVMRALVPIPNDRDQKVPEEQETSKTFNFGQMFPDHVGSTQPYSPNPWELFGGPIPKHVEENPHRLISNYKGEQVTSVQIGLNEYLFGLNGLDIKNMTAGSPNGPTSVLATAEGAAYNQDNTYYQQVLANFRQSINDMPQGSQINLVGHSMGAGVIMLLMHDPEVKQLLVRNHIHVKSVTTFGMVRPKGASGVNESIPGVGTPTIYNHFVNPDDHLALNIGAGHKPDSTTHILPQDVRDHKVVLDAPIAAHSDYHRPDLYKSGNYQIPFKVDPDPKNAQSIRRFGDNPF